VVNFSSKRGVGVPRNPGYSDEEEVDAVAASAVDFSAGPRSDLDCEIFRPPTNPHNLFLHHHGVKKSVRHQRCTMVFEQFVLRLLAHALNTSRDTGGKSRESPTMRSVAWADPTDSIHQHGRSRFSISSRFLHTLSKTVA